MKVEWKIKATVSLEFNRLLAGMMCHAHGCRRESVYVYAKSALCCWDNCSPFSDCKPIMHLGLCSHWQKFMTKYITQMLFVNLRYLTIMVILVSKYFVM